MISVQTRYQGRSQVKASASEASLGLSTNERRPVRFSARVARHVHPLRVALHTLGELVWSDHQWVDEDTWWEDFEMLLDPVITVHPDRVFFEAFSQDQSAYGLVIADREIFEDDGHTQCGTTNIDFTTALWSSLATMRSTKATSFAVGPTGFGVATDDTGAHFEEKVDLPTSWVRGFLQLQSAMSMPGTRILARPVDLTSAIRYLNNHKAHSSPRSIRYEFAPGEDVRMVLEPWEQSITLKGAAHRSTNERVVRTWGRRRLSLLEPLLPYAAGVEIYLKGRALPSFYAVQLPGVTFVLGLSGWVGNNWTQEASFELLAPDTFDESHVQAALAHLRANYRASLDELSQALSITEPEAQAALTELCRRAMVIYDVRDQEYRHREIFETPIDTAEFFPPDPRRDKARELVREGKVALTRDELERTEKNGRTFTDRHLSGRADGHSAQVVLKSNGQIIFGRCTCAFFDEHLLNRGPCEHMLALVQHG